LVHLIVALAVVLALLAPAFHAGGALSIDGRLIHTGFYVEPLQSGAFEFQASKGTAVVIVAYIMDAAGAYTDLEVAVFRPDGTLEHQRGRVEASFSYWFVAPMDGTYKVLFYNSHPEMRKYVDIAVAGIPLARPPVAGAGAETMPQAAMVTVTEKGGEENLCARVLGSALASALMAVVALFIALFIMRRGA